MDELDGKFIDGKNEKRSIKIAKANSEVSITFWIFIFNYKILSENKNEWSTFILKHRRPINQIIHDADKIRVLPNAPFSSQSNQTEISEFQNAPEKIGKS